MPGIATILQRIRDALNRTDLDTYLETFLETAHANIQGLQDWKAQETDYGVAASSITTSISLPSATLGNIKSPIALVRVAGLTTTVAIVPTQFYNLTGIQNVWEARYDSNPTLLDSENIDDIQPLAALWLNNTQIEIFPTNSATDDHFRFLYHKILTLPDLELNATDWFTDNAFDYLLYESLLQAIPFLGGNDDRGQAWTNMRDRALQRVIARDLDLKYGGQSLIMRG